MTVLRDWLLHVTAASILSSAALTLCPPGRPKHVLRLVCGVVCALALASPLTQLDIGSLSAGMAAYGQRAERVTREAEEEKKLLERTYIQDRCAAYILGKAADTGAAVTAATVLARWDDTLRAWYPWQASLTGAYDAELARLIEAELGIPPERQDWSGG